jgi:serine O-acetyltransferase
MRPEVFWWWSCWAFAHNLEPIARFLKIINFIVFHTILPYQAKIERDIQLAHYGIGIVIHPNTMLGYRVKINQNVTLAATTWVGSEHYIVIEDDVMIGSGAVIIARENQGLRIGRGAKVGANAVVTHDVLPGDTVVGVPARSIGLTTAVRLDITQ